MTLRKISASLAAALLLSSIQASAASAGVTLGGIADPGWERVYGGETSRAANTTAGAATGSLSYSELMLDGPVQISTATVGGLQATVSRASYDSVGSATTGIAKTGRSTWFLSFPSTAAALATLSGWMSSPAATLSIAVHLTGGRELSASQCLAESWTPAYAASTTMVRLSCQSATTSGSKGGAAWQVVEAQLRSGRAQPTKDLALASTAGGTVVWPGCSFSGWGLEGGSTPGTEYVRFRCKGATVPNSLAGSKRSLVVKPARPILRR